jgi:ferritin-like metal-binding protein YciE
VNQLFVHRLRTMLAVEQRLLHAVLPRLRARVRSNDLARALDRHLLETETHVENIRRVFALLREPDVPLESPSLDALERDADWTASEVPTLPEVQDAAAAEAILHAEHHEIASYQLLVRLALELGLDGGIVHLLRQNMEQDSYALEQAEHALAKLLAEKVESSR